MISQAQLANTPNRLSAPCVISLTALLKHPEFPRKMNLANEMISIFFWNDQGIANSD